MLQKPQVSQESYLQSLLSSLSPSAVQHSSKVCDQNKKQQLQIELGQLRINQFPQQPQFRANKNANKRANEKQSKSLTQANDQFLSQEDHSKALKQILAKKRALDKRKLARMKEQEEELEKQEILNKMRMEEDKQVKQTEKKKRLEEKINLILQNKQRRQQEIKVQKKVVGRLLGQNKLYQKLEKKYLLEEAAGLEEKKKRLAEIRSLHQPITREDLLDHERRIEELREKIPKKQPIVRSSSVNNIYKSNFYKKVSLEKQEKLREMEKERQEKYQLAYESKEKIKQYYRYIQNNFKPQVNEKLADQIGETHNDVRAALDVEEIKKKGEEYLKYNLKHKKSKPSTEQVATPDSSSKQFSRYSEKPKKSVSMHILPQASISVNIQQNTRKQKQADSQQIDIVYLKKQQQTLNKNKFPQEQPRLGRRRRDAINEVLNEQDLDVLYQKIVKVQKQINYS